MQYNPEILKVINRLKDHKRKKEELLEKPGLDQQSYWDAQGRITGLDHAITQLEFLYHTGESKPD